MLCTNCGQPIPDGVSFCTNCGQPVPSPETGPGQSPPAGQSQAPPTPAGYYQAAPPQPGYSQMPPPQPMPGYGPGWMPPAPPKRNRTAIIVGSVAATIVVAAGLGLGLYFGLKDDGDSGGTVVSGRTTTTRSVTDGTLQPTSTTEEVFAQSEGEIFLEPAGVAGPESFMGETFVPTGPTSTLHIPTTSTLLPPMTTVTAPPGVTTTVGGVQIASVTGDTPALYGGSKDKAIADKEGQLRFLEQNPDKAAAFCASLNADPTFKWSGGTQIQPAQLRDYFAELTPLMLTRDTRVTNHGYRDGKPTPRQSVLQKGQMVLVDQYGVPRVRCECGNPLTPPKPVQKTPKYTGPKWPGFDPTVIVVIQPTIVIIDIFVIVDIDTGELIRRPTGTEGEEDVAAEPVSWELAVSVDYYGDYQATVGLGPDGTLSGSTPVTWHLEGTTTQDGVENGTWSADVSFTVTLTGTVEQVATGRLLHITPSMSGLGVFNIVYDTTGDVEELRPELVGTDLPAWLADVMVPLDLEVSDWSSVTGSFDNGVTATLTALE